MISNKQKRRGRRDRESRRAEIATMAPTSTDLSAQEIVQAHITSMTKLSSTTVTAGQVEKLRDQLCRAARSVPTTAEARPNGLMLGHIHLVLDDATMATILSDATYTYQEVHPNLPAYDANAASNGNASQREQQVAEHRRKEEEKARDIGVKKGLLELMKYAAGDLMSEIEEDYVGLSNKSIQACLKHLESNVVVEMTGEEKITFKAAVFSNPWNPVNKLTSWTKEIDEKCKEMTLLGIKHNDDDKLDALVKQAADSDYFTASQLQDWDKKPEADKTWNAGKKYFAEQYHKQLQYSKKTARGAGYGGSLSAVDERDATEEKSQDTDQRDDFHLLFATILKDQDKRIEENQAKMEGLLADMAASIASNNRGGGGGSREKRGGANEKKWCPNCKRLVFHKPSKCLELDANASKRHSGWKSVVE